jgi:hypothetical protein
LESNCVLERRATENCGVFQGTSREQYAVDKNPAVSSRTLIRSFFIFHFSFFIAGLKFEAQHNSVCHFVPEDAQTPNHQKRCRIAMANEKWQMENGKWLFVTFHESPPPQSVFLS